ncbi:MAG: hypothetical protein R3C49_04140 [Planctomycetaceae bacterium]
MNSDSDDLQKSESAGPQISLSESSLTDNIDPEIVRGRLAVLIIAMMVLLADLTIYHAEGFSGPAAFFCGATVLLFIGIPRRSLSRTVLLLTLTLLIVSLRLVCNGSNLLMLSGTWLLPALAMSLRRQVPYVVEAVVFGAQCIPGGYEFLARINRRVRETVLDPIDSGPSSRLLELVLPTASAIVFGGLFVLANPDVLSWVSGHFGDLFGHVRSWLMQFSPFELFFWVVVGWLTGGMLRPIAGKMAGTGERDERAWGSDESPGFHAFRKTLWTLICLFVAYLIFEFSTLWFRHFPRGFTIPGMLTKEPHG